jgi:hypothetical protein
VNTQILALLKGTYGKEAPVTITCRKVHEYLGMTINYSSVKEKVKITMVSYIQGMLEELPPDMAGKSVTPAATHLFQVNKDADDLLDKPTAQFFHHNVAKLLFLCKRARPDIQTAV